MYKIGFDNDKYIRMQSELIRERIAHFGGKLYLEFGGKLFDDYHASRVLPGFAPDSKIKMLIQLRDQQARAKDKYGYGEPKQVGGAGGGTAHTAHTAHAARTAHAGAPAAAGDLHIVAGRLAAASGGAGAAAVIRRGAARAGISPTARPLAGGAAG